MRLSAAVLCLYACILAPSIAFAQEGQTASPRDCYYDASGDLVFSNIEMRGVRVWGNYRYNNLNLLQSARGESIAGENADATADSSSFRTTISYKIGLVQIDDKEFLRIKFPLVVETLEQGEAKAHKTWISIDYAKSDEVIQRLESEPHRIKELPAVTFFMKPAPTTLVPEEKRPDPMPNPPPNVSANFHYSEAGDLFAVSVDQNIEGGPENWEVAYKATIENVPEEHPILEHSPGETAPRLTNAFLFHLLRKYATGEDEDVACPIEEP